MLKTKTTKDIYYIAGVKMTTLEYKVEHGITLKLESVLFGSPNLTSVYWRKKSLNDTRFRNLEIDGAKYKGSTTDNPSLVITDVNENDMGFYYCTANVSGGEGLIGDTVSVHEQGM